MNRLRGTYLLCTLAAVVTGLCCGTSRETVVRHFGSRGFDQLHTLVLNADLNNIAVLPHNNVVVVDGLVIDLDSRTYGLESAVIPMYSEYYRIAREKPFQSLGRLFAEHDVRMSTVTALSIIDGMGKLGVGDITVTENTIVYSWDMSMTWGSNGIAYVVPGVDVHDSLSRFEFDVVEELEEHFFYFASSG